MRVKSLWFWLLVLSFSFSQQRECSAESAQDKLTEECKQERARLVGSIQGCVSTSAVQACPLLCACNMHDTAFHWCRAAVDGNLTELQNYTAVSALLDGLFLECFKVCLGGHGSQRLAPLQLCTVACREASGCHSTARIMCTRTHAVCMQVRMPPLRPIQVMAPNELDYLMSPLATAFQKATGYKVQVRSTPVPPDLVWLYLGWARPGVGMSWKDLRM